MSIKGYKVFRPDWTCRDFQYEVGKTYKHDGEIKICKAGFHFCQKLSDCFNYYTFDSDNKVAEVEAVGLVETRGDKSVTNEIKIVKELTWLEVLNLVNIGKNCTGYDNNGDCNTGNGNTGSNNTGNGNTGNCNTGDFNVGNFNIGRWNAGSFNVGNYNNGHNNIGKCNNGHCNVDHCNAGSWNTGEYNTGDYNTGDYNTGFWNTGSCNIGNYNSGDWNSIDYSTGFFNSLEQPLYLFNKLASISRHDFQNLRAVCAMRRKFQNNYWVPSRYMTEEEKVKHPEYKTTSGYLKTIDYKTACKLMWEKMTKIERAAVKDIPNFDADVFEEITGIKVDL